MKMQTWCNFIVQNPGGFCLPLFMCKLAGVGLAKNRIIYAQYVRCVHVYLFTGHPDHFSLIGGDSVCRVLSM